MSTWLRALAKRGLFVVTMLGAVAAFGFNSPYGPAIRADGAGYHAWTRALLNRDFGFCQELPAVGAAGAISHIDAERAICQNKYPPGLALLRFPLMVPFAYPHRASPAITAGEHFMSLISGALALAAIFLLSLSVAQRLGIRASIAQLTTFFIVFGTGLFSYATFDSSFTHIYSALGVMLLIWLLAHFATDPRPIPGWQGWAVLALGFMLPAIRMTSIFILVFWCLAVAAVFASQGNVKGGLKPMVFCASGVAMAVGLQLFYNTYATGHLVISSYGPESFIWDRPMAGAVLFSYSHGLFAYYPVLAIAIGLALVCRKTWRWASLYSLAIVFHAFLYGFWHEWKLGGGFGHRGFVELVPPAMVLFAMALEASKPLHRNLVVLLSVVSVYVSTQTMWAFWTGVQPAGGAQSAAEYWSYIVGASSRPLPFALAVAVASVLHAAAVRSERE